MSSLRQRLDDLASTFASSVLEAIRGASLEELLAESPTTSRRGVGRATRAPVETNVGSAATSHARHPVGRARASGRLARRTSDDIEQVIARIAGLLRQHPK